MRTQPYDEFTVRRYGLKDYVLVSDESWSNRRSFFEVYHDENELFNMEKITVNINTGEEHVDFAVYLNVDDAEKIIDSLQSFIRKCKHE